MSAGMLLQRMQNPKAGWATVMSFGPTDAPRVQTAADMLAKVSPVFFRVVRDAAVLDVLAIHDGRSWKAVGEAMPMPDDMPWWQHGMSLSGWLHDPLVQMKFANTIPVEPKESP